MVSINYALREISCKIVYYGPGLSGKTTNLQFVHGKVPETSRGELISLATEADRTLYFDFLPVDVGQIAGFATKFQLYTVPGQVFYDATRRLVLRGVDGLVFVADSQAAKMDENIESLNNMYDNLRVCGIDADAMPMVFQWNKRDLPDILAVPVLEAALNPQGHPSFEAVAPTGAGVFDTLKKITKLVLESARAKASARSGPAPTKAAAPVPAADRLASRESELVGANVRPAAGTTGRRAGREPQPALAARSAPVQRPASWVEHERREAEQAHQPKPSLPIDPASVTNAPISAGAAQTRQVYSAQKSLKVRARKKSFIGRLLARLLGH